MEQTIHGIEGNHDADPAHVMAQEAEAEAHLRQREWYSALFIKDQKACGS
jgi:hypothetical protein